jgi:hypothetical protein
MAAKKSATPKNKQPRKFPPAQPGQHTMMPDDATVLKDGETRVRKQQEKERIEELKVSQVLRKMDDPKPPNLPK